MTFSTKIAAAFGKTSSADRMAALVVLRTEADRAQTAAWRKGASEKVRAKRDAECTEIRRVIAEESAVNSERIALRAAGFTMPARPMDPFSRELRAHGMIP